MPRLTEVRRLAIIASCMLLTLPAAVMAQDEPPSPEPGASTEPAGPVSEITGPEGRWLITAYDAWGEGLVAPIEAGELSLWLFEGGNAEGTTGCGRFNGGWSLDGDWITLGMAPSGFLDCGERRTDEAVAFSVALEAVNGWRITPDGAGVELLDESERVRLALTPDLEADPTGAWSVAGYAKANGSLVEPDPDTPMTVVLRADGRISGSTGCRVYEGSYEREADRISVAPLETDGLPCEGSQRKAERRLLAVLGEAFHWGREGDVLILSDGFDQPLLVLEATAATDDAA